MSVPVDAQAILSADQADNRIRLFNPFAREDRKPSLWSYPAEKENPVKFMPTDAKRVEVDGVVHVLAAYHGRVRLIRFSDRKVVRDFSSYSSCHSAEFLPDGSIVSANSNHGMLRLHQTAERFTDLQLPYAHGVTWDKKGNCLWALGDELYRIQHRKGALKIEEKFKLPLSPTGHDLFPLRSENKLLVSNNEALFLFDIDSSKFELVSPLKSIKSASQHLDGTLWISEPKRIVGAASWQSDSVRRIQPPQPVITHQNRDARFYKARWWQKVTFSY